MNLIGSRARFRTLAGAAAAVAALFVGGSTSASAAAVTNLDLSAYDNRSWSYYTGFNGPLIAAAPVAGSTGSGITFANYTGNTVCLGYATGVSTAAIAFPPVPLAAASDVNALFNSSFGVGGTVNCAVTFTNSAGQQAVYDLVGGQTVRDYNDDQYTNGLPGSNANAAYGAVTAEPWWNDAASGGGQRLDVQTFVLPAGWAGTGLTGMTITDPYTTARTDDVLLSAAQVVAVPEPATLGLAVAGGVGLLSRRRR